MLFAVLKLVHLLCMIGTFGGLLAIQSAVPRDVRNTPEVSGGIAKLGNILIAVGLLCGLGFYGMLHAKGIHPGAHYNGVIGLKFVILLAVGALLGMSKKPGKGDSFRTICLILLGVAAVSGASLKLSLGA